MAYCGPRGIPYHEFKAWPLESRLWALAWLLDDLSKCPSCAQYSDEWVDDKSKPLRPFPFDLHHEKCWPCSIRHAEQKDMKDRPDADAQRWTWKPHDPDYMAKQVQRAMDAEEAAS